MRRSRKTNESKSAKKRTKDNPGKQSFLILNSVIYRISRPGIQPVHILLLSVVGIIILQLHNLSLFPLLRGFDAADHANYVRILKTGHIIPLANQGWELYQPPLFYLLSSLLSGPGQIRYFVLSVWLLSVIFGYYFFRKLFGKSLLALSGVIFSACLPVVIYLTPTISNELFSGFMIGFALMYYVLYNRRLSLYDGFIAGGLLGLALLSKMTAAVLLVSVIADQIITHRHKLTVALKNLAVPVLMVILISGWFYARNILEFHNPFVASTDFARYAIRQSPGDRTPGFYFDISALTKLNMFGAQHYSFAGGTIFSWIFDGHNVIIPVQPFSKAGAALILISLPLFVLLLTGYYLELREKPAKRHFILLLFPALLLISYIGYTLKFPFYSAVKGSYLVSGIIPFSYFILKAFASRKKFLLISTGYAVFFAILVIKNFWILPGWYH